MNPTEIFPQNIYKKSYLKFNKKYLADLQASIELMRRGDVRGRNVSNIEFGWQSDNLPHSGPFEPLTQHITKAAFNFCKDLKNFEFKKIEILDLWANINYCGDINWPHIHVGDIAGVYYIQVYKDSGNLILKSVSYNQHNKLAHYLSQKHSHVVKPKNDMLVLFDANCWHLVSKSRSNKPRISVSFNLKIYD
jgi:uncharacterized protein (TIGR02466 family)